jgi:hypothetical protein
MTDRSMPALEDIIRLLLTLLVCVLLYLCFWRVGEVITAVETNRQVGYGNAGRQCRILLKLGEDFAPTDECIADPNIADRFDHNTERVIGTADDHARTQRMVCSLATFMHVMVPDCAAA